MSQDELSTTRVTHLGNSHISTMFPSLLSYILCGCSYVYGAKETGYQSLETNTSAGLRVQRLQ
jgi:hypothetical protein